jgi:PPM family protein phosphatase
MSFLKRIKQEADRLSQKAHDLVDAVEDRLRQKSIEAPTQSSTFQLIYSSACLTDTGIVREHNEDDVRIVKTRNENRCLAILADGMGGHNSGEIASKMAIDAIAANIDLEGLNRDDKLVRLVEQAMVHANDVVWRHASAHEEHNGMGTTICVALMDGTRCCIGWVGDSRVYYLHRDELLQISKDDTLVNTLLAEGVLTEEQAVQHPDAHVLSQAVGTHAKLQKLNVLYIDFLEPGDRFILTSDGVHDVIDMQNMKEVLRLDPEDACHQLIQAAKKANSSDNLSAVVAAVWSNSKKAKPAAITRH